MPSCSIKWCGKNSSNSNKTNDGITFHRFPQNPETKRAWIEVTKQENWYPRNHSVICSRHFTEECFIISKNRRSILSTAIPTLNIPTLINNGNGMSPSNALPTASPPRTGTRSRSSSTSSESSSRCELKSKKRKSDGVTIKSSEVTKNKKKKRSLNEERTHDLPKSSSSLKTILDDIEDQRYINSCEAQVLSKIGVTDEELFKIECFKVAKDGRVAIVRQEDSPELETLAVTLNFYSPNGYEYVTNNYQTCLPPADILGKWYQSGDGKPGFTEEAFRILNMKTSESKLELIATLVFDEVRIKSKVEYDASTARTHGYVDFGAQVQTDCSDESTEALMLVVVGLNKRFKIPIGYFLTNGSKAEQKQYIITQAITLCHDNGVTIKAISFDGCPKNFAMAKLLGCSFSDDMKTNFDHPVTKEKVFIFINPGDMLNLVKNAFEHYGEFRNDEGKLIKWEYIRLLQDLRHREQYCLANELRFPHILFKQNVIKAKFASQLFSQAVATALRLCSCVLESDFQDVEETAEFLMVFNDLFDILDSKFHDHGYKRALNNVGAGTVLNKLDECKEYINNLTVNVHRNDSGMKKVVDSPLCTGFVGFCVNIESAIGMYYDVILNVTSPIICIPFNKMSKEHIEVIFANIRSNCGGKELTARLFESIYKNLIRRDLNDVTANNYFNLDKKSFWNCSSAVKRINLTTAIEEQDFIDNIDRLIDSKRGIQSMYLSKFTDRPVEYIARHVSQSLVQLIKCKTCMFALIKHDNFGPNRRVVYREKGTRIYPSCSVIKICQRAENIIKTYRVNFEKKLRYKVEFLVNRTLRSFIGEQLFIDIGYHTFHSEECNHVIDLAICIMHKYITLKLEFLENSELYSKSILRRIHKQLMILKK